MYIVSTGFAVNMCCFLLCVSDGEFGVVPPSPPIREIFTVFPAAGKITTHMFFMLGFKGAP